jgi:hypothetical protein
MIDFDNLGNYRHPMKSDHMLGRSAEGAPA